MPKDILASELYAASQGDCCQGVDECYWCSAPCGHIYMHNQHRPQPGDRVYKPGVTVLRQGERVYQYAARPGNGFICKGCWLWRRPRITVTYLDGRFKDIQNPSNHSWFITYDGAWGVDVLCNKHLYEKLLDPPFAFCVALVDKLDEQNHIQFAVVNEHGEVKNNTELFFTIDNVKYSYSVFELEDSLRSGDSQGKSPGVRELIRVLGAYKLPEKPKAPEKPNKGGRPWDKEQEKERTRQGKTIKN